MKKFYLIVAKGRKKGLPIPIKVDLFLIGSDPVCQLRHKKVAPEQCVLVRRDDKVFLRDCDTDVPTLLNGDLVPPGEEVPVHAGDRLAVGKLEFVIQYSEKPLSQRDLEEWALHCLDVDNEREAREGDEYEQLFMTQRFVNASEVAATMIDRLQDMRGVVKGRLRVSHEFGITVLRFNDVNLVEESELALVKREIYEHVTRPNERVLLDFKNVRRMSMAAVEMLLVLYRSFRIHGTTIALCRLRPEVRGILDTLRVLQPLPYFAEKREALDAHW